MEAGERLAGRVVALGLADPVVLALPRGGVPVALPVARALGAPLGLVLVRKIGLPDHEELAMGAVVDGVPPVTVWNDDVVASARLTPERLQAMVAGKLAEIETRRTRYTGGRAPVAVEGRDVVVVDDGIATGATMRAALAAVRRQGAASLTIAVPVAPGDTLDDLTARVDHAVCLDVPSPFFAVGAHYLDFRQTGDDEVTAAFAALG